MTTEPISTPGTIPAASDLAAVPPAPAPTGRPSTGPIGKTRNPWGVWGLSLITLGIYYLYWYFTVNSELRAYDASIEVEPGIATLAAIVPIANLVTIYNCGRPHRAGPGEVGCPGALLRRHRPAARPPRRLLGRLLPGPAQQGLGGRLTQARRPAPLPHCVEGGGRCVSGAGTPSRAHR